MLTLPLTGSLLTLTLVTPAGRGSVVSSTTVSLTTAGRSGAAAPVSSTVSSCTSRRTTFSWAISDYLPGDRSGDRRRRVGHARRVPPGGGGRRQGAPPGGAARGRPRGGIRPG